MASAAGFRAPGVWSGLAGAGIPLLVGLVWGFIVPPGGSGWAGAFPLVGGGRVDLLGGTLRGFFIFTGV